MHKRQQISEKMGFLEERLEVLQSLAACNEGQALLNPGPYEFGVSVLLEDIFDSVRDLSLLVHDQDLFKSVPAEAFLARLSCLLVQEASKHNVDLAIAQYGEGKISLDVAEMVMAAIVSSFRTLIKNPRRFSKDERLKHFLFGTISVFIEIRAGSSDILFRMMDDSQVFQKALSDTARPDPYFQKIREHVAEAGGWFGKQMFSPSGGVIEFKTPLTPNRVDGVILERKGFELIVPSSCVLEVFRAHPHPEKPQNACLFAPDAAEGLSTADFDPAILLRVGIADLQLWIGCDSISEPMKCRISSAQPFVNEGAWLRKLGMFHRGGATRALPFLDGGTLAFFLRSNGDTV